jgi:type I restriction enzyme, R subunit
LSYTEDILVQQTTAAYLHEELGWDSVYAFNTETFGADGMLGRSDEREVVLTRDLRAALQRLNPGLPEGAYEQAVRQVVEYSRAQSTLQINKEKYGLIKNGVSVDVPRPKGGTEKRRLKLIDFDTPENNRFLAVRELWVKGNPYRRRPDIMGFVNGLPLLFVELKNVHRDLRAAYDGNLSDYKDTVPHLFHYNALVVLGNGDMAKLGSLTSRYEHFFEWKRLSEGDRGAVDMETLLKGVCDKRNFLDLIENFIVFDDSTGDLIKIVAQNHQFLGVNQAVEAVRERKERRGKLGVFWHTQGSGKSYSMAFFSQKVHRKLTGSFTFLVLTDRDDLDTQIYRTFAGSGLVDNDADTCRAESGQHLEVLLRQNKPYIFSLIQKFNQTVEEPYTNRDELIVMTDEAHRTQYGKLALNMRDALPNASYIGFTGTPLFSDDEITRQVFGDYVSTYDFQRAVEDGATVPLYYDARGDKLGITTSDLNAKVAAKLEELELEDEDTAKRLQRALGSDYFVVTAQERLEQIAKDFARHYSERWESGKAMLVCVDKITAGRMHKLIGEAWEAQTREVERELRRAPDEQRAVYLRRKLAWMRETLMALVVSEEQGEVKKFEEWDIDIRPHRGLLKEGFETGDGKRLDVETAFKRPEHPFRVAVVCAMWLTGFDVPSLGTLYLDKPLKAHTLMQTIARANRVYEGKTNGLIVDYSGILRDLRKALATFAGRQDSSHGDPNAPAPEVDPVKPEEELLASLGEAVTEVRSFLAAKNFELASIQETTGFARIRALRDAKEAINETDETRRRFRLLAREVTRRFQACITIPARNRYKADVDAIHILDKSLEGDREKKDLSEALRELREVVDEAVETRTGQGEDEEWVLYDISRVDFDRLRQEFSASNHKNTTVQSLKAVIEARLAHLVGQNPKRLDLQKRYEEIVTDYNAEKDRATIEATFDALMYFASTLDNESQRAVREGLDEETLALFDLLVKPELTTAERERIKGVARGLLARLEVEALALEHWRERQDTRDAVKTTILNFLYDENTGLPEERYSEQEVTDKTEQVFVFLLEQPMHITSPSAA